MTWNDRKAGLIFDLDGTLIDTLDDIATSINLTRGRFGLEPLPRQAIVPLIGSGIEDLVRRCVPVSEERFEACLAHYRAVYREHLFDTTRPYQGVEAVLERLAPRVMGVISNKNVILVETLLDAFGMRPHFSIVLGGDSVEQKKPHPMGVLEFLARSGLGPGRVAIIGDGVYDVRAGKAAGVMTVAVTYGVATRDQLAREKPDHLIDRIEELPPLVG